jgi:hypothetical protein
MLPPEHPVVGLRQADGKPPQSQQASSAIAVERLAQKHLTQSQISGSRQTAARLKTLMIYISWYINGYGPP